MHGGVHLSSQDLQGGGREKQEFCAILGYMRP